MNDMEEEEEKRVRQSSRHWMRGPLDTRRGWALDDKSIIIIMKRSNTPFSLIMGFYWPSQFHHWCRYFIYILNQWPSNELPCSALDGWRPRIPMTRHWQFAGSIHIHFIIIILCNNIIKIAGMGRVQFSHRMVRLVISGNSQKPIYKNNDGNKET